MNYCAQEDAAALRQILTAAAATNTSSSERPAASAPTAATAVGAPLLLSPDPSAEGQQPGKGAGGELSGAVRSLLDELARLRDFSVRSRHTDDQRILCIVSWDHLLA